MSSHDLLYRRSCLFFRYLNDIGSFLPWHRIFRRSSSERFLRHKYAGSDSVKCVISSLTALLLLGPGTGVGVGVDIIHVVTWSSIEPMVATFSVTDFSQSCCWAKNVSNLCCLPWPVFCRFNVSTRLRKK